MAELTVKQNLPPSTPSKSYRQSDNIRSHHCMEFSLCDATQEERRGEKRREEGFRGIIREEREGEERAAPRRRGPTPTRKVTVR